MNLLNSFLLVESLAKEKAWYSRLSPAIGSRAGLAYQKVVDFLHQGPLQLFIIRDLLSLCACYTLLPVSDPHNAVN